MSFRRGDLLLRTRKLVKGLAKAEPVWLKAMEHAPPASFPRSDGKLQKITFPEDPYIRKFLQKYPDPKYQDAIKVSGLEPPPARLFAMRVLDLKEQGMAEEQAVVAAFEEYKNERKTKKDAYKRLKGIAQILGKEPPPKPFPIRAKETQAGERRYVRDRFYSQILAFVDNLKEQKKSEKSEAMVSGRGDGNF